MNKLAILIPLALAACGDNHKCLRTTQTPITNLVYAGNNTFIPVMTLVETCVEYAPEPKEQKK